MNRALIDYVHEHGHVTVREVATHFEVARWRARQQLLKSVRDGYVKRMDYQRRVGEPIYYQPALDSEA